VHNIADVHQIEFLGACRQLRALSLEGNAVCSNAAFAATVRRSLPALETLDDMPVDMALVRVCMCVCVCVCVCELGSNCC